MVTTDTLKKYPFFGFLSQTQLEAVTKLSKEESIESGQVIFHEGAHAEYLYILLSGSVELYYRVVIPTYPPTERELHFGKISPGEIFGISSCLEPHTLTSSARAASDSKVIMIEAAGLRGLCNMYETLAYEFIRQVAKATMVRVHDTRTQLALARANSVS